MHKPIGLFLAFVFVLMACTTNSNIPAAKPTIIPETTKVTDTTTRDALSAYDKTSGTMRFAQSTAVLANLKTGDVLVSEPSSAAPNGYLRKVTSRKTEGNEVILETTQANLTEAVSQGTLDANFNLTAKDLKAASSFYNGVSLSAAPRNTRIGIGETYNFKLSFDQVFVPIAEDDINVSGQIRVNGNVEFNAGYGVHVGISACFEIPPVCVDGFEAKVGFDQNASLSISGDVTGMVGKEIKVGSQIFNPIVFFIGPVPVVIVPRIDFYLSVSGRIEAKFDFRANETIVAQLGARWTLDNGWKNISDFDYNANISPPTLTGNLKPRAATRSSASMLLYDVAGPEVSLTGGLELNGQIPGNPTWIVSGFIKGTLGFKVVLPILGTLAEYQTTLFDTSREFARSGNTPPIITLTANAKPDPNFFPISAPRVIVGLPANFTSGCGIFPGFYFNVFDLEDGCGIGVTVTSNLDGVLPKKYTFQTEGLRTITVAARDQPGLSVTKTFQLLAYNPPPVLELGNSGNPQQGENYPIAALISDVNEVDAGTLCANTTWTVDAPDTLKTTVGCLQKVKFATQGSRQVRVTTRDSYGATTSKILTLNVQPPPVNPYPRILDAGVFSRDARVIPPGTIPISRCLDNFRAEGTIIDLAELGCSELITPRNRFFAIATIENPTNETLTYDWKLYVTELNGEKILYSTDASVRATFDLLPWGNAVLVSNNCRVTLKVNAPEASRSKSQTVWTGKCTYYATRAN